ncbi:Peptidoglycan/LPS O-acetylase OafA/YrhL, contains acyltransferase and SGNH-hydrolase domains [Friedmanniella luteola]|uniref:Peptidoglycan/LPS O-acetylase OafA/YrhL, contains acyltransferase and SGNH-hydrolase domains n=1 Tax=Friedmanniella luteola TaxID=546871 RepID=A0A1H1LNE5_9ACTN|nr:acyltransferase [Friedmanniella luteola]SDR75820.1 Peptidoglycan/LPS O-acetylase OafA/YrhL, contains acyltransferase and SGNH-hydrolase domains [Friedmanniella luteola]
MSLRDVPDDRTTAPPAPRTFAAVFDPRQNALNAIRLLLAVSVIVWHAFPLTGGDIAFAPLRQLLSHVGVDGFFTISGYLIVSSWLRAPQVSTFLRARVLRIFPGFWASLLLTALVIAPLALVIGGVGLPAGYWRDAASYVGTNAALWVHQYGIVGTPAGVPFPGVWNGSMWTLVWEFFCYLAVLGLGLVGLLKRRHTMAVAFVVLTVTTVATSYGPVDNYWLTLGSRFGLPFVAGALLYRYRDRVVVRGRYLLLAAAVVLLSCLLPDYRVVGALPLAYLMLGLGALGRHPRLQFRQDLSYGTYIYAFPLQQLLAVVGAASLGVPLFALASLALTLPLAAASWFGLEKPVLRLKHVGRPRTVQQAAVVDVPAGTPSAPR